MRSTLRPLLLAALLLCPTLAHAQWGANLLANASADDSTGSTDNFAACRAPHWDFTGTATVARWAVAAGFPVVTDPGPVVRGANFFAGGSSAAVSTFSQVVDVSWASASTLAGQARVAFGGWFGGFSSQDDHAELEVAFLDSADATLGGASTPQVLAATRANVTGLLYRQVMQTPPSATRRIRATLLITRVAGSYNDGYADSLFVKLLPFTPLAAPGVSAGGLRLRALSANPARGALRFAVTAAPGAATTVDVLDVQGRVLHEWSLPAGASRDLAWERGAQRPGVYFVRARSGRAATTMRVVLID